MTKRADSAIFRADAVKAAIDGVQPPSHIALTAEHMPFWHAITQARHKDSWTQIDLAHAANLARTQHDIEKEQALLEGEGSVIFNERGTPVKNPRCAILEDLTRRAISLSRILQVHALATVGESKESRGKNSKARAAQETARMVEDDPLLAGAMH